VKELIVHEDADAEILAEALYYEEQSAGLGLDFISEVESAYRQVVGIYTQYQTSATRALSAFRLLHRTAGRDLDRHGSTDISASFLLAAPIERTTPRIIGSRGVFSAPLPHHRACGSAPGGSGRSGSALSG
jgi:hypothetical protein